MDNTGTPRDHLGDPYLEMAKVLRSKSCEDAS